MTHLRAAAKLLTEAVVLLVAVYLAGALVGLFVLGICSIAACR